MNNNKIEFRKQKKQPNYWKWAFLTLGALLIALAMVIFVRINEPRESQETLSALTASKKQSTAAVFTINTTKKEVNTLIDDYLKDLNKKTPINYSFVLEKQALLTGKFEVLGFPLTFYLYFDPYVMEDGNIQLRAKSLSIGSLGVPIKEVMKMIKRSYHLPSWITIQPEDQYILLHLDKLKLTGQLKLRAKTIDLVNDQLQLEVYMSKTN